MSNSIIAQGRELLANAANLTIEVEEYTHGKDIFSIDGEIESSEEAARTRLQELINNAKTLQTSAESTPKKVSNFDPACMNVAKRSEQRVKEKTSEDSAQSSFKALPLPGNTPVRNNPLATTKSFEQKISLDRLVRLDNDDTASIITSLASTKNDISFNCHENENDEEREQARKIRAKKNLLKRNLLDEVNNILLKEGSLSDDMSVVQGEGDRVEDPSILAQQISQLESKLKHEKTQRLAILNDVVDIDLNALFDRLITEDAGDEAKNIIDRLKNKIYESVHDFESYSGESSQKEIFGDMKLPTLFTRQEEWIKRRDQKRVEAKMQLEADTMRGITGRPELGDAKRSWVMAKEAHEVALEKALQNATPNKVASKDSEKDKGRELKVIDWQKAKESHDQALKRATEQEELKRKTKEENEAAARTEEIQHLEALETGTAAERKIPKKERPKQSSSQSPEAMRKSKVQLIEQTRRQSKLVQQEEIFLRSSKSTASNDASSENDRKKDSNMNAFTGVSYAEMSEKDFKKLVKRISARSNKI